MSFLKKTGRKPAKPRLTVANWAGPEGLVIERSILGAFLESHPDVDVHVDSIPKNYQQKILATFAANSSPDVFLVDSIDLAAYLEAGALLDLSPYCQLYSVDLSVFWPEAVTSFIRNDAIYGLPKDMTPLVLYYNIDLLEKAHIDVPLETWTWDAFRKACLALTQDKDADGRTDQYGTLSAWEFWCWHPWIWSAGGDILGPEGKRATGFLDGPQTLSALQFLLNLDKVDGVAAPTEVRESLGGDVGAFLSGRIATAVGGHWWMTQLKTKMEDGSMRVGIAPVPVPLGGKPTTVLYASAWGVSSQSEYPQLAAELAITLSSIEADKKRTEQGIAIPAHRKLAEQLARDDPTGLEQTFLDLLPTARKPWGIRVPLMEKVKKRAEEGFVRALFQDRSLEKEMRSAAEDIDDLLSP